MDEKISEVYHIILHNQDQCLEIELKNVFCARLYAHTMQVQFITKPKRKVKSKHIYYYIPSA